MQRFQSLRNRIPGMSSGKLRQVFNNIPNYVSQLSRLRSGRDVALWFYFKFPYSFKVPDFPPFIDLAVTDRCNLSCVHCLRNRRPQGTSDMDLPVFQKIVDEVAQHPETLLKLCGQCETSLHPQIREFVSLLNESGVKWVIYTNGTLFEHFSPEEMIRFGFRYVVVSIDGTSEASFEKIRVGGNYAALKANLSRLRQTRAEWKSPHPKVEIRHVIFPNETAIDLQQFKQSWLEIADTVAFNALNPLSPQARNGSAPMFRRCRDIRRQLHMNARGHVDICGTQEVLGDLHVATIQELWRHPTLEFMRRSHERHTLDQLPACKTCHQITI